MSAIDQRDISVITAALRNTAEGTRYHLLYTSEKIENSIGSPKYQVEADYVAPFGLYTKEEFDQSYERLSLNGHNYLRSSERDDWQPSFSVYSYRLSMSVDDNVATFPLRGYFDLRNFAFRKQIEQSTNKRIVKYVGKSNTIESTLPPSNPQSKPLYVVRTVSLVIQLESPLLLEVQETRDESLSEKAQSLFSDENVTNNTDIMNLIAQGTVRREKRTMLFSKIDDPTVILPQLDLPQ